MLKNLIFKTVVGSHSYGTAIPTSDVDFKGIYMQHTDEIISFGYQEQIEINKDECYYELRRFMQLLQSANPTVLEMLYAPYDCIVFAGPHFTLLRNNKDKFLTKKCLMSFGGYAIAQIKKAKGLDKKMNWEKSKIERKTPFDFIYCYSEGNTLALSTWLRIEGKDQKYCGLVALNNFKDCYALYYDYNAHFDNSSNRDYKSLDFKGIQVDDSNSIRLSSVPKNKKPETIVYYNKDGYSSHCKDYKEYEVWLQNRNTERYVDIKNHSQQIDGKNLLHCRRLLDMATEIATTGTLNVRRPNADYLLSIRKGEVPLDDIIAKAEEDIASLDSLFLKSGLPLDCSKEFVNDLLLEIRHFKL